MLKQQQVTDLINHGYRVYRLHRDKQVFLGENGEAMFHHNGKDRRVDEHYRPWLYEVDTTDPSHLFIKGPDLMLMHRYSCLVKFEKAGAPALNLLIGVLDPTPELATEKAIDYLCRIGHSDYAKQPVLVI